MLGLRQGQEHPVSEAYQEPGRLDAEAYQQLAALRQVAEGCSAVASDVALVQRSSGQWPRQGHQESCPV